MKRYLSEIMVMLYLLAVIAANMIVAEFGQVALVFTGFFLIPFDLVTRDILHERWRGNHLWPRMALLIVVGSILSFLLNFEIWRVALASFVAFAFAGATNATVYHLLEHKSRSFRMNISNAFAAIVDSVIFPLVAFGGFSIFLSGSQVALKFLGGVMWIWFLVKKFSILKNKEVYDGGE